MGDPLTELEYQRDTQLLLTLNEVSDLVAHSHDLAETLSNIVHLIKRRFQTDVCSVYITEKETGELVLSATDGLRCESINQVRMMPSEGLAGLVAQKKAPVNVEDAPSHPRFRFFPESGEEAYRSFLGVPLMQGGTVQGVLVVQHAVSRRYSANEVRMLVAIAAQLGILVANARLTQELFEVVRRSHEELPPPIEDVPRLAQVNGTPASPGYAHGRALRFEPFDFENPDLVRRLPGTVEQELRLLEISMEKGRQDMDMEAKHLASLLGEEFGALMQAQRLMLEDSSVQRDLRRLIDEGKSVEQAVVSVCRDLMAAFQKLENPFFYERIFDIKDVFRRVLSNVAPVVARQEVADEPVIVVAAEVSLLELFTCDLRRIRGICVEKGGAYSHVAILARSLGIPMLTQVHRLLVSVRNADELFVDAATGVLFINPDQARRNVCMRLLAAEGASPEDSEPVSTPIKLFTTVNLLPEVARTVHYGGEAVGLYRSEFLELGRRSFPTEEEQLEVYRKIVRLLEGRLFTMRTLDLRAEKLFSIANTQDQSWEWRLVDQLPHVQDLLRTQLRAALRAAVDGPMRILFPMITSHRQFLCAMRLLEEAKDSLRDEGLPFIEDIPVGVMIETPSAAMMVRKWAPKIDFLCIGSNDLLHSLLGIERNDDSLVRLKTPLDPCYLRVVRRIVQQAKATSCPVTVCGEAASNPRAVLALYALGVDAVSVPPDDLPKIRAVFRDVSLPTNRTEISRRIISSDDVRDVEAILASFFPVKQPRPQSQTQTQTAGV